MPIIYKQLHFSFWQVLRRLVPPNQSVIEALALPPGLRAFLDNNLSWLLRPSELAADLRPRRKRSRSPHSDMSESSSSDEEEGEEEEEGPPSKRVRVEVTSEEDSGEEGTAPSQ